MSSTATSMKGSLDRAAQVSARVMLASARRAEMGEGVPWQS